MRNNWLPYEAREPVETASFWKMVGRENRRHEVGCQVRDVSIQSGPCMEVEVKVEEVNDRNEEPAEHHGMPSTSPPPEESVEDDGDTPLRTMYADGSDHNESMSGTRRARRTRRWRPIMVTRIFKTAKKKQIRRSMATEKATIPAAKIPLGLGMIDVKIVSPLVLLFLFLFLFAFLHLCFGGQILFLHVACFILFIFFNFCRVEIFWRK